MDGFETVRQFRQLEKQRLASVAAAMERFPSDVSSMSDEDSSENAKDEDNFSFYRMTSGAPATSASPGEVAAEVCFLGCSVPDSFISINSE